MMNHEFTWDPRYQHVTCKRCGTHYQCSPFADYYALPGGDITGPGDGYCFRCLLALNDMPDQAEGSVIAVDTPPD